MKGGKCNEENICRLDEQNLHCVLNLTNLKIHLSLIALFYFSSQENNVGNKLASTQTE